MICNFFYIPIFEVEDLPITIYSKLINQAINLMAGLSGREFYFETAEDKRKLMIQQVRELRKKGLLSA